MLDISFLLYSMDCTVLSDILSCAGASPFSSPTSQQASGGVSLLALQDIVATVQLQNATAADISIAAATSESGVRQPDSEQATQSTAGAGRNPAGANPKAGKQAGALRKQATISPRSKSEAPRRKVIKAGLELDGLKAVFNEEAVFAACQIAADAVAMHEQLAPKPLPAASEQPASIASGPLDSLSSPEPNLKQQESTFAAPQKKAMSSPKSSKYQLEVSMRLSDLQSEMRLSELVCWDVHVQTISAAYGPRCAVIEGVSLSLNSARLISLGAAVITAHIPGVLEEPSPENSPWQIFPKAEGAEDLGRALTGAILPQRPEPDMDTGNDYDESLLESASLMNSVVTELDGEGEALS